MANHLKEKSLYSELHAASIGVGIPTPTAVSVAVTPQMSPESTGPAHTPIVTRGTYGDCEAQPSGYGPIPKYDNMRGFYYSPEIRHAADNAPIPPGYIKSFVSANGSFVGSHYLGHYELKSFDTLECARRCNEWGKLANPPSDGPSSNESNTRDASPIVATSYRDPDTRGTEPGHDQLCQGFNTYFERAPAIRLGPECRESTSRTVIKCALWGEPLRIEGAKNIGYREWDFDVVIAGSNGYSSEKYAELSNLAPGKKLEPVVLAALFAPQVFLGFMAF
ncbi:hypothetical protein COCMIDRAFT_84457 [Bipolaris oryzae ATCC 44560]|uniref:Uncharacterized protein n=1 Tax=Bipolaris oryzae ATCC 44560 TaxID=930090 RepID=W6ZHJ8_COCMI|nr:uncharacterized protein COCMIDRAFT_84457 [Bipolaris oryzae ATCC 44560]EUC49470.1 hypothetical protein COCMIDRAFT_84457 [Bipolaris oryzae ATCC 44560]